MAAAVPRARPRACRRRQRHCSCRSGGHTLAVACHPRSESPAAPRAAACPVYTRRRGVSAFLEAHVAHAQLHGTLHLRQPGQNKFGSGRIVAHFPNGTGRGHALQNGENYTVSPSPAASTLAVPESRSERIVPRGILSVGSPGNNSGMHDVSHANRFGIVVYDWRVAFSPLPWTRDRWRAVV